MDICRIESPLEARWMAMMDNCRNFTKIWLIATFLEES